MTTRAPVRSDQASVRIAEHKVWSRPGVRVLAGGVVGLIAAMALLWNAGKQTGGTRTALIWVSIVVVLAAILLLAGLTQIVPGEARVVQLFGKYRGTIRDSGLQWVNPFTRRIKVSARIRNHETAQAKVNHAETAVRHVASSYPYTSSTEGQLSLRDNAGEITERLSAEIADRVRPAGVAIIESRLTRLSYAAEIAQAMLRQQQASEQATQQVVNTGSLY